VSINSINPEGQGAEPQRPRPCDAAPHDTLGDVDRAASNADAAQATLQEARANHSLERWLESVKMAAQARERRAKHLQPHAKTLKPNTRRRDLVREPIATYRRHPPITPTRHEASLPSDGWVRIVTDLNIPALEVETWLRIDRHTGCIVEFRIGPQHLTP